MEDPIIQDNLFELHADICKTLSNPLRLKIINELQEGEKTVNVLAKALGVRQANLSQHLAVLRQRGVVITRKEGSNIFYHISNSKIIQACNLMREVLIEQIQKKSNIISRYMDTSVD